MLLNRPNRDFNVQQYVAMQEQQSDLFVGLLIDNLSVITLFKC